MGTSDYEDLIKQVEFSPWFPWEDNFSTQKALLGSPGLYLLANYTINPNDTNANPLSKEVIYIGESTRQTVWTRLDNFRSSSTGKAKKKVLETDPDVYNSNHTAGPKYRLMGSDFAILYFSYYLPCHLEMDLVLQSAFIKFLERKLLWEFAFFNDKQLPILNGH